MMSDGYVSKSVPRPGLSHVRPKTRADTAMEVKGQNSRAETMTR